MSEDPFTTSEKYVHLSPPVGVSKRDVREWKVRRERIANLGLTIRLLIMTAAVIFAVIWGLREGISKKGDYRIYAIAIVSGLAFAIPGYFLADRFETFLEKRLYREISGRALRR